MRSIKRGLGTIAIVAVLSLAGGGAQAAPLADSSDLDLPDAVTVTPELTAYLDTLTPAEREEFIATQLPASVEVDVGPQNPENATARASLAAAEARGVDVGPLASGCWTQRWTWGPKANAGNTLYTYYHVGRWCASGSTVTSASEADSGAETKTPGWRYEGVVARDSGVVSNQGRSYTQHKFVLGVGGWDIQTPLECARVKGRSSGSSTADSICGIY